jgi:hypothetical protein
MTLPLCAVSPVTLVSVRGRGVPLAVARRTVPRTAARAAFGVGPPRGRGDGDGGPPLGIGGVPVSRVDPVLSVGGRPALAVSMIVRQGLRPFPLEGQEKPRLA